MAPLRVTVLSWRDRSHPEGGGAERYAERMAAGLVAAGCEVVVRCARVPGAPRTEERDGFTIVRAGGRLGVYPRALGGLLADRIRGRSPHVVVDVQNGVPFFAPLTAGCPVVVLVHHVHKEQWPIALGPTAARLGWWIESRLAPRFYRGHRYVTVSDVSREELVHLGVRADDISVVHNGLDPMPGPNRAPIGLAPAATGPQLVVLGRLVPHKRVEHALDAVARLRAEFPGVHLHVIGEGWWHPELTGYADALGVRSSVTFHGFVDETTKHTLLARADVMLAPSVKEGWGLMVVEAAQHGVPAVAYRDAGGLSESIEDGVTGLLVDSPEDLVEATRSLLRDDALRHRLGQDARARATRFTWEAATVSFHDVLLTAAGRPRDAAPVAYLP